MNKLIQPGRIIFAIGIIALSVLCYLSGDFIVGRPPAWPEGYNFNPVLAYLSGAIMIMAATSILVRRKIEIAALLIAGLILLLSVFRHLPHFMNDWANAYKSIAMFGGALIIAASSYKFNENYKKAFIFTGSLAFAAFFIMGGYAHFKYVDFVKTLIPSFIPFPVFWTYFAGLCLLVGGVGLVQPPTRKWAALLSGIMIAGWFLLLHIPRFIANTKDASDRMGLCESFTFVGIFFVLAALHSKRE